MTKSTASERSGAVAGYSSSDSLQQEAKGHLNRRSLGHLIDNAKVQKNRQIYSRFTESIPANRGKVKKIGVKLDSFAKMGKFIVLSYFPSKREEVVATASFSLLPTTEAEVAYFR